MTFIISRKVFKGRKPTRKKEYLSRQPEWEWPDYESPFISYKTNSGEYEELWTQDRLKAYSFRKESVARDWVGMFHVGPGCEEGNGTERVEVK